jgi:multiple sugar transport system ATP-binding protein
MAGAKLRFGEAEIFGIRPTHIRLIEPERESLVGEVQIAEQLGGETFIYVALPFGNTLVVEIRGQVAARPGERVGIDFEPVSHHLFSSDGKGIPGTARGGARSLSDGGSALGLRDTTMPG